MKRGRNKMMFNWSRPQVVFLQVFVVAHIYDMYRTNISLRCSIWSRYCEYSRSLGNTVGDWGK